MTDVPKQTTGNPLADLTLGKTVSYQDQYAPQLLQGVPRSLSREQIGLSGELPFRGIDIWNGYELSWLTASGKPQVGILQCNVPIHSPNLIESKSFKLYLNSFNQTRVESLEALSAMLEKDLSDCAGEPVRVTVMLPGTFAQQQIADLPGECLDDIELGDTEFTLDPSTLQVSEEQVSETLMSNLLKSNCLITNQPDWASIMIRYHGPKIDRASLLRYLISFRRHNEFHEQCVERIFADLMTYCKPSQLSVYACYTRRGGLDINPFRSNFEDAPEFVRHARQ